MIRNGEKQIAKLQEQLFLAQIKKHIDTIEKTNSSGIDDKLRKRLIQFCHPDPIQDPRKKAIAEDLTKALNGLAK